MTMTKLEANLLATVFMILGLIFSVIEAPLISIVFLAASAGFFINALGKVHD